MADIKKIMRMVILQEIMNTMSKVHHALSDFEDDCNDTEIIGLLTAVQTFEKELLEDMDDNQKHKASIIMDCFKQFNRDTELTDDDAKTTMDELMNNFFKDEKQNASTGSECKE